MKSIAVSSWILVLLAADPSSAFHVAPPPLHRQQSHISMSSNNDNSNNDSSNTVSRRSVIATSALSLLSLSSLPLIANADNTDYAPAFVQTYSDFTLDPNGGGWQYKDVKVGDNSNSNIVVEEGDRVVFDWSGYTIGYFGRPFEAKGGPQGGAFDKDLDFSRTVIGSHTVVPAVEQAFLSMKPGGVRQVVVPYGPLSYPASDPSHDKIGPKPTTFSGVRALNFVLENNRVDRTLLFNVKLVRVDKKDGKGGFKRG